MDRFPELIFFVSENLKRNTSLVQHSFVNLKENGRAKYFEIYFRVQKKIKELSCFLWKLMKACLRTRVRQQHRGCIPPWSVTQDSREDHQTVTRTICLSLICLFSSFQTLHSRWIQRIIILTDLSHFQKANIFVN